MGRSTICGIVEEVCNALWETLRSEYVKAPSTEAEWVAISKKYEETWNYTVLEPLMGNTYSSEPQQILVLLTSTTKEVTV